MDNNIEEKKLSAEDTEKVSGGQTLQMDQILQMEQIQQVQPGQPLREESRSRDPLSGEALLNALDSDGNQNFFEKLWQTICGWFK